MRVWPILWLWGANGISGETCQEEKAGFQTGGARDDILPSLPVDFEPFVHLEHVNLNSGEEAWADSLEEFWFSVMRCARDPRAPSVLELTNEARLRFGSAALGGLTWANIGLQQFHLPSADGLEQGDGGRPWQRLRGEMVLLWPTEKLNDLRGRLEASSTTQLFPSMDGTISFVGPYGNRFRVEGSKARVGPLPRLDEDVDVLPGNRSEGFGMRAIRLDVPVGSASKICEFYREIFDAKGLVSNRTCSIRIGFAQALEFVESDHPPAEYDQHHIAIYLNGPSFEKSYHGLKRRDLIYFNPRFPQFEYDTYEKALHYNEFRFINIVDIDNGQPIYELEHEVRNLRHAGFPLKHRISS